MFKTIALLLCLLFFQDSIFAAEQLNVLNAAVPSGAQAEEFSEEYKSSFQGIITGDDSSEAKINSGITPARKYANNLSVGWNLGNSLDSYYGDWKNRNVFTDQETLWHNPYTTEELAKYVCSQGFTSVRIPVTWYMNSYRDESGHYRINSEFSERVREVVDYFYSLGMKVILNTHYDSGQSKSPIKLGMQERDMQEVYNYCRDIWTEIAEIFTDYDERLCFESYNEVCTTTSAKCYSDIGCRQMNTINSLFVNAVRSTGGYNSTRILAVSTYNSMYGHGVLNDFVLPEDPAGEGRLMAAVHDYSTYFDSAAEAGFMNLKRFSEKLGIPVIVTEFGYSNGYSPERLKYRAVSNYAALAREYGIPCFIWDNGGMSGEKGYGIINRKNPEESDRKLIKSLLNPKRYTPANTKLLTKASDFVRGGAGSNGEITEEKYWGTFVNNKKGRGIPVPENSAYILASALAVSDNPKVLTIDVMKVYFFNSDMKLISESAKWTDGKVLKVPKEAAYVRFHIYSPYYAVATEEFNSFLDCGELSVYYAFLSKDQRILK